jgi:thymidylate synthase (FAD)
LKITLLARTHIETWPESIADTEFIKFDESEEGIFGNDADRLAHFAGRSCYQSWNMPNPETATDEGYIANILKQQHYSVLEHGTATFYVEGVSRNLTHELIRHRHLSYSELSQRFVNMEDAKNVIHPALREGGVSAVGSMEQEVTDVYTDLVTVLQEEGKTRKQAREAARGILPGSTETRIVVTGNHRAWRDMLHKRYSVHADAEIREFATEILAKLRVIAKETYQDFPDEPFN